MIWTAIPYEGRIVRLRVGVNEIDLTPERARVLARTLRRAATEAERRAAILEEVER